MDESVPGFQITYAGEVANVTSQFYDGVEIFRIEWPDHSLDFVYQDSIGGIQVWKSRTVILYSELQDLGKLIQEKTK